MSNIKGAGAIGGAILTWIATEGVGMAKIEKNKQPWK